MKPASLPRIDPDCLLEEDDPETLHAHARGLLRQFTERRPGYSREMIKAAAVWLIGQYSEASVPPAPEFAQLLAKLIRPNAQASTSPVRRTSEPAYWAAIAVEASNPADPTGNEPSTATLYAVGKHVRGFLFNKDASQKTAEATVRDWRKLHHYVSNVELQRPEHLRDPLPCRVES